MGHLRGTEAHTYPHVKHMYVPYKSMYARVHLLYTCTTSVASSPAPSPDLRCSNQHPFSQTQQLSGKAELARRLESPGHAEAREGGGGAGGE